jgi:hypothetical protein
MYLIEVVFVQLTSIILKGVAKAIEHCTRTQVKFTVRDGRFRQGSSNLPHWTLPYI